MKSAGCEAGLLRALASMPFLDRLEMVAVCGWSRGAVYEAIESLESGGFCASVPHAIDPLPPARRFHLTAAGLRPARPRGGHRPRRAGALPSGLRPVAAHPDGPARPARLRLPRRLRPLQRRLPDPVPLVPGHADGRRHDAAGRQDRRDHQAGTHRRPVGLRQAALAAARLAAPRNAPHPHGRRRASQARPQAPLDHRRAGPVRPGTRGGPGRSGRTGYGAPSRSPPPSTCATSSTGAAPGRRAATGAGAGAGRPPRRSSRQVGRRRTYPTICCPSSSSPPRSAPSTWSQTGPGSLSRSWPG